MRQVCWAGKTHIQKGILEFRNAHTQKSPSTASPGVNWQPLSPEEPHSIGTPGKDRCSSHALSPKSSPERTTRGPKPGLLGWRSPVDTLSPSHTACFPCGMPTATACCAPSECPSQPEMWSSALIACTAAKATVEARPRSPPLDGDLVSAKNDNCPRPLSKQRSHCSDTSAD